MAEINALFKEGLFHVKIVRKVKYSRNGVETPIKRHNETNCFKSSEGQVRKKWKTEL